MASSSPTKPSTSSSSSDGVPIASIAVADSANAHGSTSTVASSASNINKNNTSRKTASSRTSLSIHEKSIVKSFCEHQIESCKAQGQVVPSQDVLRKEIGAKFGWYVGRSTLSKILSMDWKQLHGGGVHGLPRNPHMKRKRLPLFPAFEADLVRYIRSDLVAPANSDEVGSKIMEDDEEETHGSDELPRRTLPVLTEALILEEAQRLKQVHGIKDEELVLSVGWLARFKHRNGIRLRKPSASSTTITSGNFGPSSNGGGNFLATTGVFDDSSSGSMQQQYSTSPSEAIMIDPSAKRSKHAQVGAYPSSHDMTALFAGSGLPSSCMPNLDRFYVDGRPNPSIGSFFVALSSMKLSTTCNYGNPSPRSTDLTAVSSNLEQIKSKIPDAIRKLSCACTSASVPAGIEGLNVAVIGRDSVVVAFIAAALVGENGFIVCIDSNPGNLPIAREHAEQYVKTLGYSRLNMRFLDPEGSRNDDSASDKFIGLQASHDLVICNCSFQSIVMSPTAASSILRFVFSLLKEGGEFRLAKVAISSRRLHPIVGQTGVPVNIEPFTNPREGIPSHVSPLKPIGILPSDSVSPTDHLSSSAIYFNDFRRLCEHAGFLDIRRVYESSITLPSTNLQPSPQSDKERSRQSDDLRVALATFRLFKLRSAEDASEDYGQVATYNGGELSSEASLQKYVLDQHFSFPNNQRIRVDGNTALVLQHSWLRRFFTVEGDQSTHLGIFNLSAPATF